MAVNNDGKRKRGLVENICWNGTPINNNRDFFEFNTMNPNIGFQQVTSKRKCNGLECSNTSLMLPMAPVYHKYPVYKFSQIKQTVTNQLPMHNVDSNLVHDAMDSNHHAAMESTQHAAMESNLHAEDAMETDATEIAERTRKVNMCARCLAGEPGHITHILG